MNRRSGYLSLLACALSTAIGPAQEQRAPEAGNAEAAIARWLASDYSSPELLEATVKAVLADQQTGLPHLGKLLAAGAAQPQALRTKGTRALATQVALGFLQREAARSVVYAGQYSPLQPLQPFVGELFFSWLLDTPSWYPESHRIELVPALRDLQPVLPDASTLEGVLRIVENEAIEPESLRSALAGMLWQWGKKKYAQPRIDKLLRASTEGDAEDRVQSLLGLADLYYSLREYKLSANTHRAAQSMAADAEFALKPLDWYSAACVNALSGRIEPGIDALARCVALQASLDVDTSHKVEREVFEQDPEIEALRAHPRFADLLEQALKHSPPAKPRRR